MKYILQLSLFLFIQSTFAQTITWNTTMDVSSNSFGNQHPRICLDGNDNPMILFGNGNDKTALFTRWNGSSFTMPVALNPMSIPVFAADWAGPDIASKGDTVYAVYKETPEDTNHIYLVRSFDGGLNFSMPSRVDFIGDSVCRFPTVTIADDGNPIVAFMKFNPGFGQARWVVTKSNDYGNTFTPDVLSSGFSGGDVCDCCPGAIVTDGNNVAMLYRDNLNNVRDTWMGFSNNGGNSFANGVNVDQLNWNIMSCPSTGPDGIIVDDTLYNVFTSGASGTSYVYESKNSLTPLQPSSAVPITASVTGIMQQNYVRIANYNAFAAQVWKQVGNGMAMVGFKFTPNIHDGFPMLYDTLAIGGLSSVVNADVAVADGAVHIVWQDNNSGTIKYRKGTFAIAGTGDINQSSFIVYPNPSDNSFSINQSSASPIDLKVYNTVGQLIADYKLPATNKAMVDIREWNNGVYFITVQSGNSVRTEKLIVQH